MTTPSSITTLTPSASERAAGAFDGEAVARAARCVRTDGALIIEDLVDVARVAGARRAFLERYAGYLDNRGREDALLVGERRIMVTVELEPPFDDPQLFANPWLMPILSAALDDDFVLGAFGVVCSLPGAPSQHRHRDGASLFPGLGLDSILPAAAITVAMPLLEMNDLNGTTAIWPGSHRDPNPSAPDPELTPVVREGSAVLWDYRVMHGGTPNRSAVPRPLLYLVYCRPWFFDHRNFSRPGQKQPPLLADRQSLVGLSERHERLLMRAVPP